MRRLHDSTFAGRTPIPGASAGQSDRQGSTIVVVIALLLALTFLGLVGYTIGTQEVGNSGYFSDAHKVYEAGTDRNTLFDFGLRQLILGTRLEERQSAFHGGQVSLLPSMFGSDFAPYSGQGVNLGMDNTGYIFVDQDYDGQPDADPDTLLELNRAPFSQGVAGVGAVDQADYPDPDAGYTYWDNNSPFLAYINEQHVYDPTAAPARLFIPSFHRPQYLRSMEAQGITAADWYNHTDTQRRVLRPHESHLAVYTDGSGQVSNIPRFVRAGEDAGLGMVSGSFPFNVNDGVWSGGTAASFSYDADPDGDGFNEAVYVDLDFPMQTRDNADGTTTKYVPLFAWTIHDADALFNLNAKGNLAGADQLTGPRFAPPGTSPFTGDGAAMTGSLSRSNEALAISEANPIWGMTAIQGDLTQHQRFYEQFFVSPPGVFNQVEVANIEWWWLLSGRADYDASFAVQNLYPGRFGQVSDLSFASNQSPLAATDFPKPGLRFPADPSVFDLNNPDHLRRDDNLTANLGGTYRDLPMLGSGPNAIPVQNTLFPAAMDFPAWRHPLDLKAAGRKTTNAKNRMFFQDTPNGSRHRWPAYNGYHTNPEIGLRSSPHANGLMQNYSVYYHVDDPEETILEPAFLRSDQDSVFGAGENAILHLAEADQTNLNLSGRVKTLAPINFGDTSPGNMTREIRSRYTTISWDQKAYSRPVYGTAATADKFRNWEVVNNFPPTFAAPDPFRLELRELLLLSPGNIQDQNLQRKLSINHVLDRGPDGRLRFRPLTPHPTSGLPAARIGPFGLTHPEQLKANFTVERQEWLARRDRQKLCRDIYVLLYTLGGGNDGKNYTGDNSMQDLYGFSNPDGTLDDPIKGDQCRQMAQFAVNLVDQMDSDDVITVFEYDVNLGNGWNLDDDPMTNDHTDRRVVYGVERQQFCLNEAHVILAKRVLDNLNRGTNHEATEYDDSLNRDFTYIELENVSPNSATIGNGAWQVVLKPDPNFTSPIVVNERNLTLLRNWNVPAGPNSRFTIGTAGDLDNYGVRSGQQLTSTDGPLQPSYFRVNPDYNPSMNMAGPMHKDAFNSVDGFAVDPAFQIAPFSLAGLNADLIHLPDADYSVHTGDVPGTGNGSDFFSYQATAEALDDLQAGQVFLQVQLRRRVNPYRASPTSPAQSNDNPWVVVDQTKPTTPASPPSDPGSPGDLPLAIFELQEDDDYARIHAQLRQLNSRERREPLRETFHPFGATPLNFKHNTLGAVNRDSSGNIPAQYNEYQAHFDRSFASLVELLSIPLYGPDEVVSNSVLNDGAILNIKIAADKFLRPDFEPGNAASSPDQDNRWYRLLEFLEVPDRTHPDPTGQGFLVRSPFVIDVGNTNSLGFYRRPGRVQLNTLRHPEVLGGLLDDTEVVRLNGTGLPDQTGDGTRDWWFKFLEARDGVDPITDALLPGLPFGGTDVDGAGKPIRYGSKPFRDFSFTAEGKASIENTLLRKLPSDLHPITNAPINYNRSLFELGSAGEPDSSDIDHTIRHRMLSKVLNNSTNRSNVFLVFLQVDFFEAAEVDVGGRTVVRVGGKLADSPAYRGFFVVDRSKALELITAGDLPQTFFDSPDPSGGVNGDGVKFNFSFNENFDFHQLILHRQTIN